MTLTNKTIIITGAGSGIGRAFALELARRGGVDLDASARRVEEPGDDPQERGLA